MSSQVRLYMVTSGAPSLQASLRVNSSSSTQFTCRHGTAVTGLALHERCAQEFVVSIWYVQGGLCITNNDPTCHPTNQRTVRCTQAINNHLRHRESSSGVNYAAYMHHGICTSTSINPQPSSAKIRQSDHQPRHQTSATRHISTLATSAVKFTKRTVSTAKQESLNQ
jgi:hypothetical protein